MLDPPCNLAGARQSGNADALHRDSIQRLIHPQAAPILLRYHLHVVARVTGQHCDVVSFGLQAACQLINEMSRSAYFRRISDGDKRYVQSIHPLSEPTAFPVNSSTTGVIPSKSGSMISSIRETTTSERNSCPFWLPAFPIRSLNEGSPTKR